MNKDTRLVYSTDPELNRRCPKCREVCSECTCAPAVDPHAARFTAVLRLEKSGRNGKTVTVVDRLPKNEAYLKKLTSLLKRKCGSGGTYSLAGKDGVIEIQGDQRETVRKALAAEGIPAKG